MGVTVRGLLVSLIVIMLASHNALATSAVGLAESLSLSEEDLGLNGVAIDSDATTAVVYGQEGYVRVLDAEDPNQQVEMVWNGVSELYDADFHPGGQTALIVGDHGVVLRYAKQDQSLERAASDVSLDYAKITSVAWNTAGSWAYVGTEQGQIWRMRAAEDGGAELHALSASGTSEITAIDCHDTIMMCVVSATVEGIGVIERDHTFTWVGGTGYPWTGVECPSGETPYCVAIAENQIIAHIELNPEDISASIPSISRLQNLDLYFVGIEAQEGDRALIATTPTSLVEHDISLNGSYPWLEHSEIENLNLSSDRIVGTWATGIDSGWIVTSRGYLFQYVPTDSDSTGLLGMWIAIAIPAATGLVVLCLVYLASPAKVKDRILERMGNEDERNDLARRRVKHQRKRR
ncbi:MAG: hypothetical protein VW498_06535 [Candidatus Thalassarchaeaceae archaeon]